MNSVKQKKIIQLMNDFQLDGLFIHTYENRRYFTDFTGSNGMYFFDGLTNFLWTDQRYTLQAIEQSPFCKVEIANGPMNQFLADRMSDKFAGRIGFESDDMTVSQFSFFKKIIPDVSWIPLGDELLKIRAVKSDDELKIIKESINKADVAFAKLLNMINIGMSEIDVRNELEYLMAKEGHEGPAFGTIVAFGERAAFPHAVPTTRKLNKNEYMLIDFGIKYQGYMSDMTRTIEIGQVDDFSSNIFEITLKALELSIEEVTPGIESHLLDEVARSIFREAGIEEYSLRGLGHGVGLQIHEYPKVIQNGKGKIENGMVFTVEPGIYIPNRVGVRIEDIISVTETGVEILTSTPRKIRLAL